MCNNMIQPPRWHVLQVNIEHTNSMLQLELVRPCNEGESFEAATRHMRRVREMESELKRHDYLWN